MHAGYHFSSQLKLWVPLNKGGIHPWIEFSAFMPARGGPPLHSIPADRQAGVNLTMPEGKGSVGGGGVSACTPFCRFWGGAGALPFPCAGVGVVGPLRGVG